MWRNDNVGTLPKRNIRAAALNKSAIYLNSGVSIRLSLHGLFA